MIHGHDDVVARRDGVVARVLAGVDGTDDAIALLDRAESVVEVPLVDESERARLHALEDGRTPRPAHWHSVLARRAERAVGYAGLVLPEEPGGVASGDLAVLRDEPPTDPVLSVLLDGMEALAARHGAGRLRVWLRHALPADITCIADDGYALERRLAVLGRDLHDVEPPETPADVRIRSYRPDVDDDEVVAILAAAYAGTAEGGWDRERLRARRSYGWFDPDDLLVAEGPDGLLGLHWTKRRNDDVGEVYNLAVAPAGQGRGLGALLLMAGLAHLRERGCSEALLWVDLSNERAVRLYARTGFHIRWEDVALTRTLR